jgi:hypothetical protein
LFKCRLGSTGRLAGAIALSVCAACAATPALAVDFGDRVAAHGYGHTSYVNTDGEESWDDGLVSLLFVGSLNDRSKAWVQLHSTTDITHLDWAFVDYRVTASLTVRGGQIKLPVGLYNEIIDGRFLHQSTLVPLLYQEGPGFTDENYRGGSATWSEAVGTGGVSLTTYYGEVARAPDTPDTTTFGRLAGVNLIYSTPLPGLKIGYSGFRSKLEEADLNVAAVGEDTKAVNVISLDYVKGSWDAKAEYGTLSFASQRADTGYVQLARTFAQRWTPFVRYDRIEFETGGNSDQTSQRVLTLGLTYGLNDNVSLRAEAHRNRGFAIAYLEYLSSNPGGTLDPAESPDDESTTSWGVSVNFAF